jgi:hypothetical protein
MIIFPKLINLIIHKFMFKSNLRGVDLNMPLESCIKTFTWYIHVLSANEFESFATIIKNVKTPSWHLLTMAQFIRRKVFGVLKFHDYHVLMQQILPLALKGFLGLGLWMAIMRVSKVFRRICSKVWDPFEIHSLWNDVATSLILMEMHFPPSFFDIMTHILCDLVDELDICGPIATRWMYPIERYMKTLKFYVQEEFIWLEVHHKVSISRLSNGNHAKFIYS